MMVLLRRARDWRGWRGLVAPTRTAENAVEMGQPALNVASSRGTLSQNRDRVRPVLCVGGSGQFFTFIASVSTAFFPVMPSRPASNPR